MRAALYARVSTSDKGQDPGLQLRELSEFCEARGWTVDELGPDPTGLYVDSGISGAKESRPELDRLMANARRRRFDVVLVWKFDRFARSVSHLLRALDEFRSLGIEFVSLTEAIDTSTPVGKMVFTVLGAVAELERSITVERVNAGLRNARAKGKRLGRPRVALDASQVDSVINRLRRNSYRQLATELGVSAGTLHRIVKERCSENPSADAPATR